MTYQPKGEGLFGVKIRFAWTTSAMQPICWDCSLSEDEIRSIKEADHQDYKFTIERPRADSHPFLLDSLHSITKPSSRRENGRSMMGQKLPSPANWFYSTLLYSVKLS